MCPLIFLNILLVYDRVFCLYPSHSPFSQYFRILIRLYFTWTEIRTIGHAWFVFFFFNHCFAFCSFFFISLSIVQKSAQFLRRTTSSLNVNFKIFLQKNVIFNMLENNWFCDFYPYFLFWGSRVPVDNYEWTKAMLKYIILVFISRNIWRKKC